MSEATSKMLAKAERAIAAGAHSLAAGYMEAAAARAYYAMFYVAEALLNERGLRFRKHGGVHAAFGQHFAKPGLLDPKYHRWLLAAFNKRIVADYGIDAEPAATDVQETLHQAREFAQEARHYLETSS